MVHHIYDSHFVADDTVMVTDCGHGYSGTIRQAGTVDQDTIPRPAFRDHSEMVFCVTHPTASNEFYVFMVEKPPVFFKPYFCQRIADPLGSQGCHWIEYLGITDLMPEFSAAVRFRRCHIIA